MDALSFPEAELVLSAAEVTAGIDRLAAGLQVLVDADECVLLGVMNGGLIPLVRLAERLQGDFLIDYCHATRYRGAQEGGQLVWERKPSLSLQDRCVIVVDDIWDEGTTLAAVASYCAESGAAAVATAVLFIKDRPRPEDVVPPDFDAGLRVPDRYVFGCGMDLNSRWRHLPAVYALVENGA